MFLVGALFGLVTVGVVVPCLIDVAVAPDREVRGLAKQWWVLLIVFGSVFGAAAWLLFGRPRARARMQWPYGDDLPYLGPEDAQRRHPAGRGVVEGADIPPGRAVREGIPVRPVGPDDDAEFLHELTRRIHGDQADNDA